MLDYLTFQMVLSLTSEFLRSLRASEINIPSRCDVNFHQNVTALKPFNMHNDILGPDNFQNLL